TKAFYHPEQEIKVVDLKNHASPFPEPVDKVLSVFRLAWIIRREQPDFLVSYSTLLNVLNGLISLVNGTHHHTRHIGSERNSVLRYTKSRLWRIICRIFYHGLAALYANNAPAVNQLQTLIGLAPERTCLIPNLLDTDYYQRQPEQSPAANHPFTILIPARVCDQKNQAILIPVASSLKKSGCPVQFILAGSPEPAYASVLKQQISAQQLDEFFVWKGQQADIRHWYLTCNLVLLPSKFEGLSNSFIEAMACGAIVMGSRISSFTTVIEDGINGYIMDIDQPEAIASKIQKAMQLDLHTSNELRQKARATVLEYGPEGYYRRFLQMLDQVRAR
ncbi:MAG: glycosyltransferase, partial [Eubacteriales bacterium]|nr:glycosyltransferase [Eubacteriales bacterium]